MGTSIMCCLIAFLINYIFGAAIMVGKIEAVKKLPWNRNRDYQPRIDAIVKDTLECIFWPYVLWRIRMRRKQNGG